MARMASMSSMSDDLLYINGSLLSACLPYLSLVLQSVDLSRCFGIVWSFALTSSPSPLAVGVDSVWEHSSFSTKFWWIQDAWVAWSWLVLIQLCFLETGSDYLRRHCLVFCLNFWHFLHRYLCDLCQLERPIFSLMHPHQIFRNRLCKRLTAWLWTISFLHNLLTSLWMLGVEGRWSCCHWYLFYVQYCWWWIS